MRLVAALAGFALNACAVTVSLNPSYFPRQPFADQQRVDGRALIITLPAEDAATYSGPPTSVVGGGTTLTVPLGLITREATAIAFGDLFRDGADRTNLATGLERYRVVVDPRITRFEYAWAYQNGLEVVIGVPRPLVAVTLTVGLLDPQGRPTWERSYNSGIVAGERDVGRLIHRVVYDLARRAAEEVAAELRRGDNALNPGASASRGQG